MLLLLTLDENVIGSTAVDPGKEKDPEYLYNLQLHLLEKHAAALAKSEKKPHFYLALLPSALN